MIGRHPVRWGLAVVVVAALAGCSRDMADLERYVSDVKARQSRQIDPIPPIRQFEAFEYVAGTRPDPFIRPEEARSLSVVASSGPRPDPNRPSEPLEDFPLDSLRMLGIIDFASRRVALVRAPDGVIHRVARGDHMGQNYGQISDIAESQIDLNELIPDGFGGWIRRPAALALTP